MLRSRLIAVVLGCAAGQAAAQQIDPEQPPPDPALSGPWVEWSFGAGVVTSVDFAAFEGRNAQAAFNFSDSVIYLRPRVPLTVARDLRAGALFAFAFPDAYERPGALLIADAHVTLENRWAFFRLGRGRLKSHIIPAPALRDDDLIRFAEAQNPFSDGASTADHQFGNIADLTLWPTPRLYADIHLENLSNAVLGLDSLASFAPNSVGVTLGYRQLPAMTTLSVVRQVGVGANAYRVALPERGWIFDVLAGGWLNLIVDPVHTVDLRAQVIYADGAPGADPTTPNGSFRARNLAAFTSLGYTYRRSLLPTLRANAAAGYRRYLDQGADQLSVLGNVSWALGLGVEVGVQYQYRKAAGGLPRIFGEDQTHAVKVFITGTFETVVNPLFDDRASLLNTESGYLP